MDFRRVMLEELAAARAQLERSTHGASVVARARDGAMSFVLGGMGGALGAAGQPPDVIAAAAGGAGLGAAVVSAAVGDSGPSEGTWRHYVLFDRHAAS
ncbi:hypothetical protein DQ244_04225 [Blastococcus sp. TBT05-19]|nr:hypothetical protein DQ244_04225 [Blastococcus sp. TBT05-19]